MEGIWPCWGPGRAGQDAVGAGGMGGRAAFGFVLLTYSSSQLCVTPVGEADPGWNRESEGGQAPQESSFPSRGVFKEVRPQAVPRPGFHLHLNKRQAFYCLSFSSPRPQSWRVTNLNAKEAVPKWGEPKD